MIPNRKEAVYTPVGTAVMEWQRCGVVHTGGVLSLPDPPNPGAPPINYRVNIYHPRVRPTDHFQWARITLKIFDDCKGRSFDGDTRTILYSPRESPTAKDILDGLVFDYSSEQWRMRELKSGPTRTVKTR